VTVRGGAGQGGPTVAVRVPAERRCGRPDVRHDVRHDVRRRGDPPLAPGVGLVPGVGLAPGVGGCRWPPAGLGRAALLVDDAAGERVPHHVTERCAVAVRGPPEQVDAVRVGPGHVTEPPADGAQAGRVEVGVGVDGGDEAAGGASGEVQRDPMADAQVGVGAVVERVAEVQRCALDGDVGDPEGGVVSCRLRRRRRHAVPPRGRALPT